MDSDSDSDKSKILLQIGGSLSQLRVMEARVRAKEIRASVILQAACTSLLSKAGRSRPHLPGGIEFPAYVDEN
jgi:hypothetical protein